MSKNIDNNKYTKIINSDFYSKITKNVFSLDSLLF